MAFIREYVLGITAAAMICAITLCFAEKSSNLPLIKLICGLILTFSLAEPFLEISAGNWEALGIDFQETAAQAAQEGKRQGENTVRQLIKQETEAYIMDKARELNLSVKVTVTLSDQALPVPESAVIEGVLPPFGKSRLSQILINQLGIPKEKQRWIS